MIGIFGGSFDPPHKGHLKIIQDFWKKFPNAHALYVIPNNLSPFKSEKATPSFHIAEMSRILVEESKSKKTYYSDFEITKKEKSYTIDTLLHFKKIFPQEDFFILIGEDNLLNFQEWKDFETILEISNLLVFPRGGYSVSIPQTLEKWKNKIKILETERITISSTEIRENLQKNKSNLTIRILEYVVLNRLYEPRRDQKI